MNRRTLRKKDIHFKEESPLYSFGINSIKTSSSSPMARSMVLNACNLHTFWQACRDLTSARWDKKCPLWHFEMGLTRKDILVNFIFQCKSIEESASLWIMVDYHFGCFYLPSRRHALSS